MLEVTVLILIVLLSNGGARRAQNFFSAIECICVIHSHKKKVRKNVLSCLIDLCHLKTRRRAECAQIFLDIESTCAIYHHKKKLRGAR